MEPTKTNREMLSLNEDVYNFFSVEELEQRLQNSAVAGWGCGTDCGGLAMCTCFSNDPPCVALGPILL